MIIRERIVELMKGTLKRTTENEVFMHSIYEAADRILAELEPEPEKSFESAQDKPKTLVAFLEEHVAAHYPSSWVAHQRAVKRAVKNWLASKPKEMTVEQLLAELEKEEKE